jgi:hypothetical protein
MKRINKISNVDFFKLVEGKAYYTTDGSKPFWMALYSEEKLLVPDKVCLTQFFPLGDTILFAKWQEPYTYELNLKTGVERVVRDEIVQDVSEQYINYRNSVQKTNSYVNRASGARYVLPYILCEYLPDGGIAENDTEIFRVDWSGNILWSFPLVDLGEDHIYTPGEVDRIVKILGVVGGLLWFKTDFARLIALDITTGKPVYQLSCNPADQEKPQYKMVEGIGRCYLREEDKAIVGISSSGFQAIDPRTAEVIDRFIFKEADPDGIGTYRSVFHPLLQGDYFTFLGEKEGEYSGIRKVGIFDYKARRLVWEGEVISEEEYRATGNHLVAPQPLYMSGSKLYIRDFQDTLHIFERVNE